ncbi:PA-phosphatase [Mycobacterium sp. AZCC_0083]|uniref:PA-phosphatase n=1 Tax=Mycobacterium sp. AZCC_0083 TaxID=2735882 RepID=UPI00161DE619|nr:PA-phosphatase [Mycobacterium sp. AZCC_0083]MBB5161824.1 energy-converting hydrogenase Eha subunit A [Mycobacterium sp. AZCC_0083]
MTATTAVRWWPLVGLAGLVALGLAVGKGTTPVDAWFTRTGEEHPLLGRLLFFTDGRVVLVAWAIVLAATLFRRRWRLAAVDVATPLLAVAAARLCKRLFGRLSDGVLAYPSGHTTLAVVVLGLAVLAAGVTVWSVAAASVVAVLGVLGQAFTYHYFTDTIGAVFLGISVVCLAAWAAGFDRCQPDCDLSHNGG